MKKTYSNPLIHMEVFSAEEILTDVIKASGAATAGDIDRVEWEKFIG